MRRLTLTALLLALPLAAPLAAEPTPASDPLMERARQIIEERCHLCHGKEGEGSSAIYPRLAAQNADYIVAQLKDFKSGARKGTMNEMAADLSEEEMVALGAFFAAKPARSHRVRDEKFAAVGLYLYERGNRYSGVPACKGCHGDTGMGTDKLPRLAGQHKHYVMGQLEAFGDGSRKNSVMNSIASQLTELEVEALARYISGMK